ncbi:MAG: Spi family protease inhibitor, partial [Prevotella sp.]|nr:Spi family protease inhibitor [Prevotella sp.]
MAKRLFFVLMLMTIGLAGAWADEVSEKDAQALAKSFVNGYFGRKGGSGPNLQGQMEKLGFYVFNMTDKGGFVIVSNESETTPILGYSETGSIELDPDKMPENMRNWLQGYADEIAWLQKQENYGKIEKKSVNKARTRAVAKENITNTILLTRWNQRAPYNNQCPDYSSGNRSVT